MRPGALPTQVSSPQVSSKQPEVLERVDARPAAVGLKGWLWWETVLRSRTTWQAALGVRGDVPTKRRWRARGVRGCGEGWGASPGGGSSDAESAAGPCWAEDRVAAASEVQGWGGSLTGRSRQSPCWSALLPRLLLRGSAFLLFFFNVYLFLRERRSERETECERGRGREQGRHRIQSRLQASSTEPDAGLEPTNHEMVT